MTTAAEFFATVVAELDTKGVRLTARPGQYVVNFRNGTHATVYITDDLTDAIEHGRALAKSFVPATPATTSTATPGKRYRRPRRVTPKAQRRRLIRQHNRQMQARAKQRDKE